MGGEDAHPVAGNDLATVVHQGGGIQLLSRLVEANAIPDVHRRHHTFFAPVSPQKQVPIKRCCSLRLTAATQGCLQQLTSL